MANSLWVASDDAKHIFYNSANLIEVLSLNDNNSKAALMLVSDWMFRWSELSFNDHRDDISQIIWFLKRKLKAIVYIYIYN